MSHSVCDSFLNFCINYLFIYLENKIDLLKKIVYNSFLQSLLLNTIDNFNNSLNSKADSN